MDLGHWKYPGEFEINEWFGFIYRIIDLTNDMEYIGKKQFFSTLRKPVKGKIRKKIVKKESDWKDYTSSSTHLNEAILIHGKEQFIFLIESLHKTKGSLYYAEVDQQVYEDVLRSKLPNGNKKYYNKMIAATKFIPPELDTDERKMKISASIRSRYTNPENCWFANLSGDTQKQWEDIYRFKFSGNEAENNGMFGRTGELSPRYGVPHTAETKQQISEKLKGRFAGEQNPMYGKNPHDFMSPEDLADLKKRMSHPGEKNGMYGKSVYDIVSPEKANEMKQKISKAQKGKVLTQKTKDKMAASKQGPQRKSICPHCGKEGGASMMTRYHFNKCKKKEGN